QPVARRSYGRRGSKGPDRRSSYARRLISTGPLGSAPPTGFEGFDVEALPFAVVQLHNLGVRAGGLVIGDPPHILESRLPQQLFGKFVGKRSASVVVIEQVRDEVAADGRPIPGVPEVILVSTLVRRDGSVEVRQTQAEYSPRLQHATKLAQGPN